MAMSRKQFVAIAAAVRESVEKNPAGVEFYREVANKLAAIFADENDRFDRARFIKACGV